MRRTIFLLLCIVTTILYAQQITACDRQLHNYYVTLGLRSNITLPVVRASLIAGGIEVTFQFESVARFYQSLIGTLSGAPLPTIEYISFDYPWCTTSIQVLCGGELRQNLPKTADCQTVVDYDLGGASTHAGRILLTRNVNCTSFVVRLLGNMILFSSPDTTYSYSIAGLPPLSSGNITAEDAIDAYQQSLCLLRSGTEPSSPPRQTQMVCGDTFLGCGVTSRPDGDHSNALFTPVPLFACHGNVTPGGPPMMVWHINGYGLPYRAVEVSYTVHFCARYDAACAAIVMPAGPTLVSGTRNQYISPFDSFNSVLVFTYNKSQTYHDALYIRGDTPFIRDVPCVCGLSIDCDPLTGQPYNGTALNTKKLMPGNVLPVADAGSNYSIVMSETRFALDGSASIDSDQGPNILSYYWKVYNTTPSPVVIVCPTCAFTDVRGTLVRGNYTFILYVSDGQDVTYDIVNVLADENVIRVILSPDFDAQFDLITECLPLDAQGHPPRDRAIILNGSLTYNENPAFPLFYEWRQTTGNTLPLNDTVICDPATVDYIKYEAFWGRNASVAYFIPSTLGLYCFRLTVDDGTGARIRYEEMCVSVENDFDRQNGTDRNYTDYPDGPSFNHSDPSVPILPFEPATQTPIEDITRSPSATLQPLPPIAPINTTSPGGIVTFGEFLAALFPQLPPPSMIAQLLLLFVTIACLMVFLLLTGYCIAHWRIDAYDEYLEQTVLQQQQ